MRFKILSSQDAHELLRHLMDGLRSEEVRRQRLAILKHYGLNDKTDPKTVEEKTRQKVCISYKKRMKWKSKRIDF